jgi:excisionase family DNA binding protein
MEVNQPLYSVPETLALLKIGRTLFYKEVAAGRIKAVKSGQRTLVPAQSIKDWIESLPALPVKSQGVRR